jgi:peptidoglycan LD-endopeptidase CwlK
MPEKLKSLDPEFVVYAKKMLDELNQQKVGYFVEWGLRTKIEQARLFSMGRVQEAAAGFTRNRPGESFHNYGMAIDIHPVVGGRTRKDHPRLQRQLAEIGKNSGLVWGGDFMPPEPQHFQMPGVTLKQLQERNKKK